MQLHSGSNSFISLFYVACLNGYSWCSCPNQLTFLIGRLYTLFKDSTVYCYCNVKQSSHIPITALLQFCTITVIDTACEEGYTFSVDGQNCTGKPDTSCVHKAPVHSKMLSLVVLYSHAIQLYCVEKYTSA